MGDTEMKLYWNPEVNPSADLANTEGTMEDQGYELVKDWHDGCTPGTDGCGFQNCPKFCEDTDGATCFGDFTVPAVDASGYYTFVWYWVFNPGSPYITCWEAYIDKDGAPWELPTPSPVTDAIAEYITEIPVCIEGQSYSADDVAVFVEAQFEFTLQSVTETAILNVSESSTGYEFTAKVTHDDEGADVADIATNDFCREFEAEYGSSVDCDISDECGEMRTYAVIDPEIPDDAITVTSTQSMGAWYLNFVMEHIDDCFDEIAAVQLVRGDSVYQDHDQYWYGSGHTFGFLNDGSSFADLLPISLRILFDDGSYVDLEDILTNLESGSVFTSSKSCDGEVDTDTTATLTTHSDNKGTHFISNDGGASWTEIGTAVNWPIAFSYDLTGVSVDTKIRVSVSDVGVIGGFIATVLVDGQQYSTTNPLGDGHWKLVSASDGDSSLVYREKTSSPWRISTADIASDASWVWNGGIYNTLVFEFDFDSVFNSASARSPSMNEQAVGTMPNAEKSGFAVELTAQELWMLLSVSVVFIAVMVLTVVWLCRPSGKRQLKYDPVEFETESEMEEIRQ